MRCGMRLNVQFGVRLEVRLGIRFKGTAEAGAVAFGIWQDKEIEEIERLLG